MGLREEKKKETHALLADAAVRMFTEHGYDEVTMADIAAEVGVSRRTAFRYFPSKDDLLMLHPDAWVAVFNAAIDERAEDPLEVRLREASYAVAAHIEADPVPVQQLFGLAYAHPTIAGRYAVNSAEWVDRMTEEIQRDHPHQTESRMLAAAVMGVINTACEIWAMTQQPMVPLLDTGFALIALPEVPAS